MKDDVINIFKNSEKALELSDLEKALGIDDVKKTEELLKVLKELEDEVFIYHTKKDKYMLLENSPGFRNKKNFAECYECISVCLQSSV